MNWKQPINTDCKKLDLVTRLVFMEIMISMRNEDMEQPESFFHGNKRHMINLKRGQMIFSMERFSKESGISISRTYKAVKILSEQKDEFKLKFSRQSYGLTVTAENYTQLVSMKFNSDFKESSKEVQSEFKEGSSNKSEKIEEIEEKKILTFQEIQTKRDELIQELTPKFQNRDVSKAWSTFCDYYQTHDGSKVIDWKRRFELWVERDQFKSFTITPRFKAPEKSPVFHVSQRELSPAAKEKAHLNALRIKEISLAKKKPRKELTREERIAQITGTRVATVKVHEVDTEPQFNDDEL